MHVDPITVEIHYFVIIDSVICGLDIETSNASCEVMSKSCFSNFAVLKCFNFYSTISTGCCYNNIYFHNVPFMPVRSSGYLLKYVQLFYFVDLIEGTTSLFKTFVPCSKLIQRRW